MFVFVSCSITLATFLSQHSSTGSDPSLALHIVVTGSKNPPLVCAISGPSNVSGTAIHIWGAYDPVVTNQKFLLNSNGALVSVYNGQCLGASDVDPATGKPAYGASIQIFSCNASDPGL